MESFFKASRSNDGEELILNGYHATFILLYIIAKRAKRTESFSSINLQIGEALIGDWKKLKLTEQQYRTAKANLEKWGFATFRTTNRGTIATLTNTSVFDINVEHEQRTEQRTNNEQTTNKQRTNNEQTTTNKNDNKEKNKNNSNNEKKSILPAATLEKSDTFETLWKLWLKKTEKPKAQKAYQEFLRKKVSAELIEKAVSGNCRYFIETKKEIKFQKSLERFLKNEDLNDWADSEFVEQQIAMENQKKPKPKSENIFLDMLAAQEAEEAKERQIINLN